MPIGIEHFEDATVDQLRTGGRTNAEEILTFLATSPDRAYTPKEIHEGTGVARGSVGVVLSRLEERGLVRHRGDYWAIADVESIDETLTGLTTARAATDQFGPEDPEEWGPGVDAEDPEGEG